MGLSVSALEWLARPNKPGDLDEDDWTELIRQELTRVDPAMSQERSPASLAAISIEDLDLELLAARAVVNADARSTGTGGRFSDMDIRAEAAARTYTVTLLNERDIPKHIKHRMPTATVVVKTTLANRIDAMAAPGDAVSTRDITAIARALDPERVLDGDQTDGAAALAGTAPIVSITGAAGTGKTTMLKVAGAALRRHRRNMIIVAPTKKASTVAGRETDSAASAVHQFLHDYG